MVINIERELGREAWGIIVYLGKIFQRINYREDWCRYGREFLPSKDGGMDLVSRDQTPDEVGPGRSVELHQRSVIALHGVPHRPPHGSGPCPLGRLGYVTCDVR